MRALKIAEIPLINRLHVYAYFTLTKTEICRNVMRKLNCRMILSANAQLDYATVINSNGAWLEASKISSTRRVEAYPRGLSLNSS